jgi:hypothetical protein
MGAEKKLLLPLTLALFPKGEREKDGTQLTLSLITTRLFLATDYRPQATIQMTSRS